MLRSSPIETSTVAPRWPHDRPASYSPQPRGGRLPARGTARRARFGHAAFRLECSGREAPLVTVGGRAVPLTARRDLPVRRVGRHFGLPPAALTEPAVGTYTSIDVASIVGRWGRTWHQSALSSRPNPSVARECPRIVCVHRHLGAGLDPIGCATIPAFLRRAETAECGRRRGLGRVSPAPPSDSCGPW